MVSRKKLSRPRPNKTSDEEQIRETVFLPASLFCAFCLEPGKIQPRNKTDGRALLHRTGSGYQDPEDEGQRRKASSQGENAAFAHKAQEARFLLSSLFPGGQQQFQRGRPRKSSPVPEILIIRNRKSRFPSVSPFRRLWIVLRALPDASSEFFSHFFQIFIATNFRSAYIVSKPEKA